MRRRSHFPYPRFSCRWEDYTVKDASGNVTMTGSRLVQNYPCHPPYFRIVGISKPPADSGRPHDWVCEVPKTYDEEVADWRRQCERIAQTLFIAARAKRAARLRAKRAARRSGR